MTVAEVFENGTVARSWSTTYGHPGVLDNGVSSPSYIQPPWPLAQPLAQWTPSTQRRVECTPHALLLAPLLDALYRAPPLIVFQTSVLTLWCISNAKGGPRQRRAARALACILQSLLGWPTCPRITLFLRPLSNRGRILEHLYWLFPISSGTLCPFPPAFPWSREVWWKFGIFKGREHGVE